MKELVPYAYYLPARYLMFKWGADFNEYINWDDQLGRLLRTIRDERKLIWINKRYADIAIVAFY